MGQLGVVVDCVSEGVDLIARGNRIDGLRGEGLQPKAHRLEEIELSVVALSLIREGQLFAEALRTLGLRGSH